MGKRGGPKPRKRGALRTHERTVRTRAIADDGRPDSAVDDVSKSLEELDVANADDSDGDTERIGVPLAMWVRRRMSHVCFILFLTDICPGLWAL